jgi:hypothetical protein
MTKTMTLKGFFGEDIDLTPKKATYKSNGRLAILLFNKEGDLFCDLTVNLGCKISDEGNGRLSYVDSNNYPFLPSLIEASGIGRPTSFYGLSGFFAYPEYEFSQEALDEMEELER